MKILIPSLAVLGGLILLTVNLIYAIRGRRKADRPVAPTAPETDNKSEVGSDDDDNEFEVESQSSKFSDFSASVTLDSDIECQPCLNHFRYHSRDYSLSGIAEDECEYEYRIDGTKVFVRLLQQFCENPVPVKDKSKKWDVRDGVVLEDDMRARDAAEQAENRVGVVKEVFDALNKINNIDEHIANLKKKTEWSELLPSHWNGLKHFILSKKLPSERAIK
ncbi:MAG: hypothetical protein WB780_02790 [Candidatus Acidiferrales bacterium]